MADDIVFELLHSEIINYALEISPKEKENKKVGARRIPAKTALLSEGSWPSKIGRQNIYEFIMTRSLYGLENRVLNTVKEVDLSIVEYIGFAAGYKVMERLTREWPRFKDELDTMKFICTDFWTCIYKKQIDNLRTNHQGVYVLQDNAFRFLTNFSNGQQYLEFAPRYVAYTCGLIRGGLANLSINSIVTAEVQTMPSCKFHIHVQRS